VAVVIPAQDSLGVGAGLDLDAFPDIPGAEVPQVCSNEGCAVVRSQDRDHLLDGGGIGERSAAALAADHAGIDAGGAAELLLTALKPKADDPPQLRREETHPALSQAFAAQANCPIDKIAHSKRVAHYARVEGQRVVLIVLTEPPGAATPRPYDETDPSKVRATGLQSVRGLAG